MKAKQLIFLLRFATLATYFNVTIPLCFANCGPGPAVNTALERSPTSIQRLATELEGMKGDEIATTIVKHFGPAARHLGSGVDIQQWDVDSGVLTYTLGQASFRAKGSRAVVWLPTTVNKALSALTTDSFEMYTQPSPQMKYWLGNLYLRPNSTYKFVDSGYNLDHRADQKQNFFINHPIGRFEVRFARGCVNDTALEGLAEGALLCTLAFSSTEGGGEVTYGIAVYPNQKRLVFSTTARPPVFLMEKAFPA